MLNLPPPSPDLADTAAMAQRGATHCLDCCGGVTLVLIDMLLPFVCAHARCLTHVSRFSNVQRRPDSPHSTRQLFRILYRIRTTPIPARTRRPPSRCQAGGASRASRPRNTRCALTLLRRSRPSPGSRFATRRRPATSTGRPSSAGPAARGGPARSGPRPRTGACIRIPWRRPNSCVSSMSCVIAGWRSAGLLSRGRTRPAGRAGSIQRSSRASMALRMAGSGATQSGRSRQQAAPSPAMPRAGRQPVQRGARERPAGCQPRQCGRLDPAKVVGPPPRLQQSPGAADVAAPQLVGEQVRRHRQPLVAAAAGQQHPPACAAPRAPASCTPAPRCSTSAAARWPRAPALRRAGPQARPPRRTRRAAARARAAPRHPPARVLRWPPRRETPARGPAD